MYGEDGGPVPEVPNGVDAGADGTLVGLVADGMIAELEMRSAIAADDREAMAEWIRRGPEIRSLLRDLHGALGEFRIGGVTAEMTRAVLAGLAGTFATLVSRHSSAVLRSES